MPQTCLVLVDNQIGPDTWDLVRGLNVLCPEADVAWYDSGATRRRTLGGVITVRPSRPLKYVKVIPALLDILEWAAGHDYENVINVEIDMVFVRPGFVPFVEHLMENAACLSPRYCQRIPAVSQWHACRSLRAEIPELLSTLGVCHLNRGFSLAQVFGRKYIHAVVNSEICPAICAFVERNQSPGRSHTLQEVLMPTLVDRFGLRGNAYPVELGTFNRFRPHQNTLDVAQAMTTEAVHFLHPVRRNDDDPVRSFARSILDHYEKGHPMPQIVDASEETLASAPLRGADLFEAELGRASLREANLSGAYLVSADLRSADLSMSYVDGAILKSALLVDADLSGACMRGAVLREADLTRAHLNGANLNGSYLGEANLSDADIRRASLAGADLREADVSGADFTDADLRGALLNAVRWSSETRWPSHYREAIVAASTQIAENLWVVRDDAAGNFDLRLDTVPARTRSHAATPSAAN